MRRDDFDAAILDLDGTLVDTLPDFLVALNATLGELGWGAVDHGFVARTVGKGSEHLIRCTLAQVGLLPSGGSELLPLLKDDSAK